MLRAARPRLRGLRAGDRGPRRGRCGSGSGRPAPRSSAGPLGASAPATGDWVEPDVVLAPLLAFDRDGWRLGYGGGYYDRTLADLRARGEVTALGFAFAGQQVEAVPHGPDDARLDGIVTEAGLRCRSDSGAVTLHFFRCVSCA